MGIDDIGLDDTVEQAAEVFKKASEAVKSSDGELLKKLMDAGFDILKLVAMFA